MADSGDVQYPAVAKPGEVRYYCWIILIAIDASDCVEY